MCPVFLPRARPCRWSCPYRLTFQIPRPWLTETYHLKIGRHSKSKLIFASERILTRVLAVFTNARKIRGKYCVLTTETAGLILSSASPRSPRRRFIVNDWTDNPCRFLYNSTLRFIKRRLLELPVSNTDIGAFNWPVCESSPLGRQSIFWYESGCCFGRNYRLKLTMAVISFIDFSHSWAVNYLVKIRLFDNSLCKFVILRSEHANISIEYFISSIHYQ